MGALRNHVYLSLSCNVFVLCRMHHPDSFRSSLLRWRSPISSMLQWSSDLNRVFQFRRFTSHRNFRHIGHFECVHIVPCRSRAYIFVDHCCVLVHMHTKLEVLPHRLNRKTLTNGFTSNDCTVCSIAYPGFLASAGRQAINELNEANIRQTLCNFGNINNVCLLSLFSDEMNARATWTFQGGAEVNFYRTLHSTVNRKS